ncbi:MAG: hypothetical protein AB8B78_01660 [Polaribacter sp.]
MSLQISEQNETFYLNGKLNAATQTFFVTYFEYNLSQSKSIIINIDKVTEIDRSCLDAMRKLTINATLQHKVFSILGVGCKEIYEDFNENFVA